MSDLPRGWEWTTLGEITAISLGKMLDKKQATGLHPTPYLRNLNVRWGGFDLSNLADMDIRPDELDRVLAQPGDVIACEGGEPGRAAVWRGPGTVALQKALHRIRPSEAVLSGYVALLLHHLALSRRLELFFTGTTINHIPKERLRGVPVPLPPLAEQERIVAAIEEHLTLLDTGIGAMSTIPRRVQQMTSAPAEAAWRALSTDLRPLGEVGRVVTGTTPSTKEPDYWGGDQSFATPGDLEFGGQVRATQRQLSDAGFGVARWLPGGAVLVTCIGATLGKAAVTLRPMAFNQQINGLLPSEDVATPGYLLAALSCPSGQRRLREASSSTTLPILNRTRFTKIEVPIPPLGTQRQIEAKVAGAQDLGRNLMREVDRASTRALALRRSILAAAFTGRLVPQRSGDEPASVLLQRIKPGRTPATRIPGRRTAKSS